MLASSKTLSAPIDPFSVPRHQHALFPCLQRAQLVPITSTERVKQHLCRRRWRHHSHAGVAGVAASTSSPISSSPWICPTCSSRLSFSSSSSSKYLSCPNRHCYDISREGYVNLTRSGRKAKRGDAGPAGDAPESLAARSRFFSAGHFDRVIDAACDAVVEVLLLSRRQNVQEEEKKEKAVVVLDAGCGEGTYLMRLARRLSSSSSSSSSSLLPSSSSSSSSSSPQIRLLGVDVAKAAVRSAASRAQREEFVPSSSSSSSSPSSSSSASPLSLSFAVASAFDLPLPDASVSCALVAFAPLPSAELRRVLIGTSRSSSSSSCSSSSGGGADNGDGKGGREASSAASAVVVVGPGPEHFFGLKRAVYGEDRARRKEREGEEGGEEEEGEEEQEEEAAAAARTTTATATRKRRRNRRRIRYTLGLDGPSALDLLTMTPYFWRCSAETMERLSREGLETEVDVFVDIVERDDLLD